MEERRCRLTFSVTVCDVLWLCQTSLFSAKAQPGNMLITSTDKVGPSIQPSFSHSFIT